MPSLIVLIWFLFESNDLSQLVRKIELLTSFSTSSFTSYVIRGLKDALELLKMSVPSTTSVVGCMLFLW